MSEIEAYHTCYRCTGLAVEIERGGVLRRGDL
jgi:hypothetical protein